MSSSPEAATAELWRRRAGGAPAVPFAAALTGGDLGTLADTVALALAASPEAARLLDSMEVRIRTLTTGVSSTSELCIYSVRGPVLWSETITARGSAFGNEDVFVCSAAQRSFDTVENRVLVAALESIARAGRALRGAAASTLTPHEAEAIASVAEDARRWRSHPRLAAVRGGRLSGRDTARLRGGHRLARMAAVTAVRDRAAEPFGPRDVSGLCDGPTAHLHRVLLDVLDAATERGLASGELDLSDGVLRSGGVSFRHPAAGPGPDSGLRYRGVPLLPAPVLVEAAPWRTNLADRGIEIGGSADAERVVERITERERSRSATTAARGPAGQRSTSSSSPSS